MPGNLSLHLQARNKATAMIARKLNDKNVDMDYHLVLPPDYKAGGDSKREKNIIKLRADGSDWSSLISPGDWKP